QFDGCAERLDIAGAHIEDGLLELEAEPFRSGRCRRIQNSPLHEPAKGSTTPNTEPAGALAAMRATSSPMRFPRGSRTASSAVRARMRTPRPYHWPGVIP